MPSHSKTARPKAYLLIIAQSGRMLAHAAKQAGYRPLVIDLFADQDTLKIAEQLWQVEQLSITAIQQAIIEIQAKYKVPCFVYGSGIENQPETLAYLVKHFTLIGNDASLCQQLSDKRSFFKQLSQLNIAYPEVQFHRPEDSQSWLIKPIHHAGGQGISDCNRTASINEYYQKFCTGQAASVLFCSDGKQFDVIGFQRQWTLAEDDFSFAGIIQDYIFPNEVQNEVLLWLTKLVANYQLKGLASLDFIWNGTQCYFLEINPRPPASMMLYPSLDLFTAHLTGKHTEKLKDKHIHALQILYAKQGCRIPKNMQWPAWSFDLPAFNSKIAAKQPICSIIARAKTTQQTLDVLLQQQQLIENHIY
ncbi:MAG: ATP-grasp domain-containing protein [Methyloprofundus sp.]|nr:ATP-grasp domain-containing protein [Methyloprofundus sp.]